MKNYYTSQVSPEDREVYCINHYPRVGAARLDQGAIGIKGAVSAQENFKRMSKKLDSQIRKPGTVRIPSYDANAIAIKRILTSPKAQEYTEAVNRDVHKINLGPDAMGIKQPVAAQKMHTKYQHENARHQYQPKVSTLRYTDEPLRNKASKLGFRPGPTQTGLYSHRSSLET